MKKISLLLAALSVFSTGYCVEACDKTYVQHDQIALSEKGIFVYLNDAWVAAEAVHSDASGMYVTNLADSKWFVWECPKCGFENSSFVNQCGKCGYR